MRTTVHVFSISQISQLKGQRVPLLQSLDDALKLKQYKSSNVLCMKHHEDVNEDVSFKSFKVDAPRA